jgi:hypothetical protein
VVDIPTTKWYINIMAMNRKVNAWASYWDACGFGPDSSGLANKEWWDADATPAMRKKLLKVAESAKSKFKRLIKTVYEWDLIDEDAFLESADWPYLWKK